MKPIYIVLIAAVTLAAGFIGGMQWQKVQTAKQVSPGVGMGAARGTFQNGQRFTGANRGMMNGARAVAGEVTAVDDKSITVKTNDGSSKIVLLSEKTQINKSDSATIADIKTGTAVRIFGTDNSDGTVTAADVQLNPVLPSPPVQQ